MGPGSNQASLCPHGRMQHNCLQCHPASSGRLSNLLHEEEQHDSNGVVLQRTGKYEIDLQRNVEITAGPQVTSTPNDEATNRSIIAPSQEYPASGSSRVWLDIDSTDAASPQVASPSPTATTTTQAPSLRQTLAALTQIQTRGTKRPYSPQPNRIGAQQTYTMNRFIDEISDFRSLGLSSDEQMAVARNKRRRVALKTRLRALEVMIGV